MRRWILSLVSIVAFSQAMSQTTYFSENFNGSISSWSVTNVSVGGTVADGDWKQKASPYAYLSPSFLTTTTFSSPDNSSFVIANSDEQYGADGDGPDGVYQYTHSFLRSPSFSTVGASTVTLRFSQYFEPNTAPESATIEASDNGTTWTTVATLTTAIGTSSSFVQSAVNLNAFANKATVYIRFNYYSEWGFYWAIDNIVVNSVAISLPVSLQQFSGYRSGRTNVLNWITSTEQNNKGFFVERSADGSNFSDQGFVPAQSANGNSDRELKYNFVDQQPTGDIQYYRLRQVDIDGRTKTSNVIAIKSASSSQLEWMALYPNPARNNISLNFNHAKAGAVRVDITDVSGRILQQKQITAEKGSVLLQLPVSDIRPGIYFIRLSDQNGEVTVRSFMKE